MRLTRSGKAFLALMALTLAVALASGNNLLYLLYSLMLSSFILALAAARLNLRGLSISTEPPQRIFLGSPFFLRARLSNRGPFPSYLVRLRALDYEVPFDKIERGEEREVRLRAVLPHRGRNLLEGIALESSFPFGLVTRRVPLRGIEAVALPRPSDDILQEPRSEEAGQENSGSARPRKGAGDELHGVRAHEQGDEARLINWKLTARTGRMLINEFAEAGNSKITVRLEAASGEEGEARIRRAASLCKRHIDAGAEVRLVTPETEVPYGKGQTHLDRLLLALALQDEGARARAARMDRRNAGAAPRMSANFLTLAYLLALTVYLSLFLIEEVNPRLLIALSPVFPLGWWLDKRGGPRLPQAAWNAASLAMLAYGLLADWQHSGVTLANTHLVLYLLVNRLLNPKTPGSRAEPEGATADKDMRSAGAPSALGQFLLICFLAFFLVSGQTISLWYFLYLLLFSGLAALWMTLSEGGSTERRYSCAPALGAWLAACLLLSGAAFAATPRLDPLRRVNPFSAIGLDKLQPKTEFAMGFTENVSLGFFGQLKKSSARVLRVKPLRRDSSKAPFPVLHLRGGTFDYFDGRSWRKNKMDFIYRWQGHDYRSSHDRAWLPRRDNAVTLSASSRPPAPVYMEYTLLPLNSAVLFSYGRALSVEQPDNALYFDHAGSIYFGSAYVNGITYRAASSADASEPDMPIADYESLLRRCFLQLPELDPRILQLARRVTRSAPTPLQKMRAVELYLRHVYSYSIYSNDPHRDLADFLFSSRSGNCEYFATAAVVLLRAAGVPARLVTGFLADDWNEYGRFYDVRQSHAHAWVEAYSPGVGWVTVDATPGESDLSARANALRSKLEHYFNALQLNWYRNVIGYDRFLQKNAFYRFRLSFEGRKLRSRLARLSKPALEIGALALFIGALGLSRRKAGKRPQTHFERALRLLARLGLRKPAHQTSREFARELELRTPGFKPLSALAELHYEERYSGRGLGEGDLRRAARLLEEIDKIVRS